MKRSKYKKATQEERDLADMLNVFADRLRDEARAIYAGCLPKPKAVEHGFWRALLSAGQRATVRKRRKTSDA